MTQSSNGQQDGKIIVHVDPDLKALIPGFLQNRYNDLKTILAALEQGDHENIRLLGHNMKGYGGGYGFDAITDIGRSLEQAAKDKNSVEIRKWVRELATYLERVEVIYK